MAASVRLGWPHIDISYRSGSRHPEHAVISLTTPGRKPLVVEVDTLLGAHIHMGAGYASDATWTHGQWRGRTSPSVLTTT